MNREPEQELHEWLDKKKKLIPSDNITLFEKIINFIEKEQIEISDLSFDIANLLIEIQYDIQASAAALLINLPRKYSDQIRENFRLELYKLIQGFYKMNAIDKVSNKSRSRKLHGSNLRQMFLSMVNDPRVIVVKLAEQYCYLLKNQKIYNAKQLAQNIMDIYAPLANRLGIGSLKWRLEDIAFLLLEPSIYSNIASEVGAFSGKREKLISSVTSTIENELISHSIKNFQVTGRPKNVYSIYKKMKRKNVSINEVYDSIAIRIHLPTISNCYDSLSIVHKLWKNIPDEFDDYINQPKANGYRSLHTDVIHNKHQFEVQIRTFQMHEEAEYGIAAHWLYKANDKATNRNNFQQLRLNNILQWKEDFSKSYLSESQDDKIYVFSPMGDVIDLPKYSTPIDFAYSIHTDIGHMCSGAKVNDKIVPLNYKLQTGDQINIITNKNHHPSRDWLVYADDYIKTARAKLKVTQWFNNHDSLILKEHGKEKLEKLLKQLHLTSFKTDEILSKTKYKKIDDLYIAIAKGEIKITSYLIDDERHQPAYRKKTKENINNTEILIHDIGNMKTTRAKCCNPEYPDQIIGYLTQSRGIYIHKLDCNNILSKNGKQLKRFIQAQWNNQDIFQESHFFEIEALNTSTVINDITKVILDYEISILSFQTKAKGQHNIVISIICSVKLAEFNWNDLVSKLKDNTNILTINSSN